MTDTDPKAVEKKPKQKRKPKAKLYYIVVLQGKVYESKTKIGIRQFVRGHDPTTYVVIRGRVIPIQIHKVAKF